MFDSLADVPALSLVDGFEGTYFKRVVRIRYCPDEMLTLWIRALKGQKKDFPETEEQFYDLYEAQRWGELLLYRSAIKLLAAASALKEEKRRTKMAVHILDWVSRLAEELDEGSQQKLEDMWERKCDPAHLIRAASKGDLEFIKHTTRITPESPRINMSYLCTNAAARGGHKATFDWLIKEGVECMWGEESKRMDVRLKAAEGGSVEVMQYIKEECPNQQDLSGWPVECCSAAEGARKFDALRWLRSSTPPCPWGPSSESDPPNSAEEEMSLPLQAVETRLFEVTLAEALAEENGKELPMPPDGIAASVR